MKRYRSVIVGTGGIASAHVRAAEHTQGRVEIVAVVDIDDTRMRAFRRDYGIPKGYTDFDEMLRAEKPDLVQICVPPALHAPMSIAAMEAGAWVLCEKPLCRSLSEFDRIAEAEKRTGCFTACVFQMRFASSTEHLRKLVVQGLLGRPLVAVCNTLWYRDSAYYAVPWRGTWSSEIGGPTVGLGIHAMDHLLHLLGPWTEVRAVADTLARDIEVEDVSMALVRFANGATASIVNSALSPRQETYIRLDFQRATVELTHLYSYSRENWRFTPAEPMNDEGLLQAWQLAPVDVPSSHGAQLVALVDDMDHGRRPLTSGDESRQTIELLTAIYRSAFTGEIVRRGVIGAGDPFYEALNGGRTTVGAKKR
ncbi:Gfo/Idh/MocA family oxidoreductase [Opitutales bacterium ASA1]|uniref:Gfo/Idh/MocA family protein n=1 Tax=Congregicoccus parvus TaxID=3081749 RepID=UPI002B3011E2|nr:Gfo/Idh/MocA family oxidoreductase [Opitutales bacterium ASA1]